MRSNIQTVGVVGAGTMGQGIAQAVAMAGYQVLIYDIQQSLLDQALVNIQANLDKGIELGKVTAELKEGTLQRINTIKDIDQLYADLVIEAVVEDLGIKQDLFLKLERINQSNTIFATNTSSIPVTRIGAKLRFPERLAGLHFFNPAHIMKLVEIVKGENTATPVIEKLTLFAESIGKLSVQAKDSPGFIVNRVARHYYLESLRILEDQVADQQDVDDLLTAYGFRMGPFKLMDLIGVDVNLAVTQSIFESFQCDPRYKPSWIQQRLVDQGHLGRKSGKGFYSYE
jgi:3-hydroxybutyryl-CoA dehydrogenase